LKAKKTGNVIRGDCVLWYRKDEILEAENETKNATENYIEFRI
jgi:hypothetical protein